MKESLSAFAPVNCIGCHITFMNVNAYLHPSHRCVVSSHPSANRPAWMKASQPEGNK